jgi:hypothetical protein
VFVQTVETTDSEGNDFDWLCFDMSEVTRQELMLAGMRAAKRLLKTKCVTHACTLAALCATLWHVMCISCNIQTKG